MAGQPAIPSGTLQAMRIGLLRPTGNQNYAVTISS
ncbi:hypothetical protein GGP42_001125 [Salinibacter ruber]|nr:hypothetical protein [Salinibacter ruber]